MTYNRQADLFNQGKHVIPAAQASGLTRTDKARKSQPQREPRQQEPAGPWMWSPAGYVASCSNKKTFSWVRSDARYNGTQSLKEFLAL
jgi:hypothetical protein